MRGQRGRLGVGEHLRPWRVGSKGKQTIYDASEHGDGGQPGRSLGRMDTPELAAEVVAAVNEVDRLRDALVEIRKTEGRICGEYDTCSHPACASSYAAWAIADRALGPRPQED